MFHAKKEPKQSQWLDIYFFFLRISGWQGITNQSLGFYDWGFNLPTGWEYMFFPYNWWFWDFHRLGSRSVWLKPYPLDPTSSPWLTYDQKWGQIRAAWFLPITFQNNFPWLHWKTVSRNDRKQRKLWWSKSRHDTGGLLFWKYVVLKIELQAGYKHGGSIISFF